ncbi:hypothetical protein GGS21DRAFT_526119 [Xylaria nigripes]|nr:hypothetical protein GGS21DRAFT_526119 [Xylaria nigripes]
MDINNAQFDYPGPEALLSPEDTVTCVLENVGASYPTRDGVDEHLGAEVKSWGTDGDETVSPMFVPGYVAGGMRPVDTDHDGIPDEWEQANRLDCRPRSVARVM